MSGDREAILAAVRAAQGGTQRDPAAIAAEAAALLAGIDATRPDLGQEPTVERFAARVVGPRVNATLERIATLAELPAAVRRYLEAEGQAARIALQPVPELEALGWPAAGVAVDAAAVPGTVVGLARYGIAETGSLVFHSGPDTPVLYAFLPLYHVVAVRAATVLRHLEDYAAAEQGRPVPRNVNFITGFSGTTDIEGSYVRGAHGPRFLHIVLVG
ncbi:MAG: LUD domain-containing protein [Geminicoccaceae bacterium]